MIKIIGRKWSDRISEEDLKNLECFVGELKWVSAQTHLDVAFDVCELSGATRVAQIEHIHRVNKVVKKIQERTISLKQHNKTGDWML